MLAELSQTNVAAYDAALIVDVLVTWIGAATLGWYVIAVGRGETHAGLGRRTRFLVGALAATLFVRGFSWLTPDSVVLALLTFLAVSVLPLAMTLFTESLLRRHAPPWMKWLAVLATLTAFVANGSRVVVHGDPGLAVIEDITLAALVVTLTALGWLLFRRDWTSLSRTENAFIRTCVLMVVVMIPLAVTDFRFVFGWPAVRFGTVAPLLLCYTMLRTTHETTRVTLWVRDVLLLVAKAALLCGALAIAIRTLEPAELLPLFALALTIVFAFAIWERLRVMETKTAELALLEWLAHEPATSMRAFERDLRRLPLTSDATLVGESDLTMYNFDNLRGVFTVSSPVYSLATLQRLQDSHAAGTRGVDELVDLLRRSEATHVALVSRTPLRLLVTTLPEHTAGRQLELSLAAVIRRAPLF